MKDITYRAVEILRGVQTVFCEDTRQTKKILDAYGISAPLKSLHSHSSAVKIDHALSICENGSDIAYCTDCGTPGISDPGARLVSEAYSRGFAVFPVPGPSALAAVASITGFSGRRLIFAGFLPKKRGRRRDELMELSAFHGTIVIYESPYRFRDLISEIAEAMPGREVVIAREMTKFFEEYRRGKIEDILSAAPEIKAKGEFVIAVYNEGGDLSDKFTS
jgi:16S rRNA (cytidine1402-2'-O)-methyltransferase